jgi:microcystin-dependent protein
MWAWLKALFARLFGGRAAAPVLDETFRPGPTPPPPPTGMQQLLATSGQFPQPGNDPAAFTLGMIESFAGSYAAFGMQPCVGGELSIAQHQPLVAIIGMNFGGDEQHIGVPNLHGRVAIGGGQIGLMTPGALTLTWLIATSAESGAPMLGAMVPFGGNFPPAGWAVCDGSILSVRQNVGLYETIGTVFGGQPSISFTLPNLTGAAPVGVGPGMALGQKESGTIGGLGLYYLIATEGQIPPQSGAGGPPDQGAYAGQVIAFAGSQIPDGWAVCDGSLLAPAAYPALFQTIGNLWGGDGKTSFALPDLRGKMLPGA